MKRSIITATLLALVWTMGCGSDGSGGGDAFTSEVPGQSISSSLGNSCGSCEGTFCQSNQGDCWGSSLPLPCIGTAAGMYCSDECTLDEDCPGSMHCLMECPDHPEVAGMCWKAGDHGFMVSSVCGEGGSPGSTGSVTPTSADPCEQCADDKCGYEMDRCNSSSSCVSLANCIVDCYSDSCVDSCIHKHISGAQKLIDLLECMDDHCKYKCD